MKKLLIYVSFFFTINLFAADIPADVIGTENLNNDNCEGDTAQTCILNTCMNSSDTDCNDTCRDTAKQACAQKRNE